MADFVPSGDLIRRKGTIAWAPLLDSHDPNPPITIESPEEVPASSIDIIIRNRPSAPIGVLTIGVNLLQTTLAPVETPPFFQTEWPNPLPKREGIIVDIGTRPVEDGNIPFAQHEWPNPILKRRGEGFIYSRQLGSEVEPERPFSQSNWPNPPIKGSIVVDISSVIAPEVPVKPPVQVSWPNPIAKERIRQDWSQERPFFYQDIKPFNQNEWPNPLAFRGAIPFHIHSRKLDEPIPLDPFIPVIFDNPKAKAILPPQWIYLAPFQEIFTRPVSTPFDFPTPVRKPESVKDWIQPRPSFYVEPSDVIPIGRGIFPSHLPKKSYIIVTISSRFPQPAETGKPHLQRDWPNPLLKKKFTPGWIDYFIIDENLPPVAQSTILPLRKRPFVPTWIQSPNILTTSDPPKTFDWTNPVIVKRPTQTHLVNLLQSTLDPGVGEKPFNQNEWPIPQRAATIHPSGWIHDKRFYYTEEPLIPAQYDWPVFRPVNRNHVGFVHFIRHIEEEQPLPTFASITDVPKLKQPITLTFAFNPIIDLTAIIGAKPFNQTEWPIPLRFKSSRDLLTWLGQNPFILPQVVGRIICLMMSENEFYLDISSDEFDLGMRADEYDLDMGGRDCE